MSSSKKQQDRRRQKKLRRDLRTLALFAAVYCRTHHRGTKYNYIQKDLPMSVPEFGHYLYCKECQALLNYAIARRLGCPLDPKPACRACPHNCYAQPQREAIRKVMAFAGPYLVKRGRFDLLWRIHFG